MRFRIMMVVSASLLVAATSCGEGEAGDDEKTASADSTKTDSTKVEEGVPVKVRPVELGRISDYVQHTSTIETEEVIDVYAQTNGLVREVLVEEGDEVTKGQVLVRLVDDELRLGAAEARVNHQKLANKFKRSEGLFERNLLSKEDFEEQKFTLEESKIRWERANVALAHASVRSPVSGVISERAVKLGDRISTTNKLFSLVDLKKLIAYVHVPGRDMRYITTGQRARLTTDFLAGEAFGGYILRISPVVDPRNGTFKVALAVDESADRLRPGMFITVNIVTATRSNAVLVPKRAIVHDDGFPHVFVVEDSVAIRKRLEVGFEDSDNLEVLSGTAKGDLIVVVGQNGLKDEAKVRVIEGEGLQIPAKPDSTDESNQAS